MKRTIICLFVLSIAWIGQAYGELDVIPATLPVPGMVTMVDLGAKKCIPCRMMAPILEELHKEYEGRAAVVFIDIWEEQNKPYIGRFGIRAIPTQIFFDKDGKEVWRHLGFLDKANIVDQFAKLQVPAKGALINAQ